MFIQTETTPNPATLKFLPGRSVLGEGVLDLRSAEDADLSPLAQRLFDVNGVAAVMLGSDFVTVTKADSEWPQIKPAILGAIMEHFMSGAPVLSEGVKPDVSDADEFFDAKDAEIVATIKELLETRVRPAVANDGGDITFRGLSQHEGLLLRMPVFHRHAQERHRKSAEALRAGSHRSPGDLTTQQQSGGIWERSH